MGMMSQEQYADAMYKNRTAALQGYAQQLTTHLQQTQTDIEAFKAHADVMYKQIMADIGLNESLLNQAQEYYEMYMAPYYADLERYSLQLQEKGVQVQEDALQNQKDSDKTTAVLGGAGTGATIGGGIGAMFGGIGAPVGAAIGGLLGGIVGFFL